MKYVVMFSGGIGSWASAKRAAASYGTDGMTLLFADTLIEDADLYRFIREAADDIGAELVTLIEGRTPWEVFRDVKFLGNTRIDPCSRVLKREPLTPEEEQAVARAHAETLRDPFGRMG